MSDWSEIIGRANDGVLDAFGDPENLWTYSPKAGGSYSLDGILERAPELVDLQGNVQQAGDEWTFDYKAEDLPVSPAQGDQLSRTGELYEVIQIDDDTNLARQGWYTQQSQKRVKELEAELDELKGEGKELPATSTETD